MGNKLRISRSSSSGTSYRAANCGMYSRTSATFCSVVTTISSVLLKTRRAALPATALRSTLLSAATLLIFDEFTLDLLVRDSTRVKLPGNVFRHGEVEFPADLDRHFCRIAQWVHHGSRLSVLRDQD